MKNLENEIRKAFSCTAPLDSIPAEDARELNYAITRFDHATVIQMLPLLMLKEMYESYRYGSTGEGLIFFLDGALLKRDKMGNLVPRNKEIYAERYRYTHEQLKDFTKEQAYAIVQWLKQVATPKYNRLCSVDILSALSFWENRSKEC